MVVSLKGDKGMTRCSVIHYRRQQMKSNCVCVRVCEHTRLLVKYHMNRCPPPCAIQFPFSLTRITQKHGCKTISDDLAIHAHTQNTTKFFKPFCIDVSFPVGAML